MPPDEKKPKQIHKRGHARITTQFYDALVDAYRKHPGNHSGASRAVGCNRRTAKRGWEQGWSTFEWARPINEVIRDEQELARIHIERQSRLEMERQEMLNDPTPIGDVARERRDAHLTAQLDRAKARDAAVKSRAEEGQMVAGARKSVMQGLGGLLRIGEGVQILADRCNDELKKLAKDPKDFKLASSLATIRKYALAIRDINSAAQTAVELERLYLGEPTEILGVQLGSFDDAPMEDVLREIEKGAEAIKEARAQGIIPDAGDGTPSVH